MKQYQTGESYRDVLMLASYMRMSNKTDLIIRSKIRKLDVYPDKWLLMVRIDGLLWLSREIVTVKYVYFVFLDICLWFSI